MIILTAARRRLGARREDGQALIVMVVTLVVLLGFAGLVVDFGRAYLAERQLQQAVDAASLAAGQTLPNSTKALQEALNYSATGQNQHPYSMDANAPTVTFKCLATLAANNVPCNPNNDPNLPNGASTACNGTNGATTPKCNAVQVKQTAKVSTFFARLFVPHLTVSAKSTAGMRGGVPHPLNIMIVLDRTESMDDNCNAPVFAPNTTSNPIISAANATKIDCAKDGIRKLLTGLLPCNQNINGPCGNAAPLDQVGLMVFPALNNKNGTNHSLNNDASHNNLNLETSSSCSGEYKSNNPNATNPPRPPWYLPSNLTFPDWFLTSNDVGYGTAAKNEQDQVTINQNAGTFTLTFAGQTTGVINWNAPPTGPGSVQNALGGLSTIGGNANVTVSKSPANGAGTYTITYVGALAARDVGPLTAAAQGVATPAPTVTTTVPGGGAVSEVQSIALTQTSGAFRLTYNGNTTGPLQWNAPANTGTGNVESALAGLNGINSTNNINVTRTGNANGPFTYTITFVGGLANQNVNQITGAYVPATVTATTTTNGRGGGNPRNEVQSVALTQTSGTFALTYNGNTTGPLQWNAPANTGTGNVESALAGLNGINSTNNINVTRTGNANGPFTYTITFVGALGNQNILNQITGADTTSAPITATTPTTGGNGTNEVQTVTASSANGTFTLTFNGDTTDTIAYNASANTVDDELTGLSTIGNNDVTVGRTGSGNGPYVFTITFTGNLGNQDVPQIVANSGVNISNPTVVNIPFVPGINADYSFAPLSNNFRLSDAQGLNPASRLVQAITWSSCVGLKGQGSGVTSLGFASEVRQGYPGNQYYGINAVSNTYYAGALNAAQAALDAEASAFPLRNAQPVIILLSDGEANTGGTTPCHDAIDASHSAALAGTWVYSIAYKLDSTARCQRQNPPGGDEVPRIDAYTTMANIARNSNAPNQIDLSKFFCPGTVNQLPGLPCQDGDTLAEVFQSIGTSLTAPRLYSDDTQ